MGQTLPKGDATALGRALLQMESALHLLDEAGAPADIGAHLDLALSRLREVMPDTEHRSGDGRYAREQE